VSAPVAINRAAAPDGPYGSVRIGIAPSDLDGVTLGTLDLDADNSGSNERGQVGGTTAVRFGRLRMENAVGSEKLDLPISIQLQYWAGTAFQVNAADSCTPIAAANIQLSDYFGGIDNTNVTAANLSPANLVFASGVGNLTVTKPLPAPTSPGAVTLTVNLTAEAKSYLKGNWGIPAYTADPKSRAAFGLYGGQPHNFIYFRENY
jgi:MSHA biogenesis protein MshQ